MRLVIFQQQNLDDNNDKPVGEPWDIAVNPAHVVCVGPVKFADEDKFIPGFAMIKFSVPNYRGAEQAVVIGDFNDVVNALNNA
jgi:hypothetical protein